MRLTDFSWHMTEIRAVLITHLSDYEGEGEAVTKNRRSDVCENETELSLSDRASPCPAFGSIAVRQLPAHRTPAYGHSRRRLSPWLRSARVAD
ncbi:hypothetical protein GCM10009801_07200 [Streptomyces albiaxialis]|uniref:Uncharacterized protein n=1 Tax=Streptomyces albiaxialis TaxID=329523 RepID=A0ABP5H7N6_9ACTN